MKGGTMTALGNTARGGTAGQRRQGAARRWAAQRGQRQQGAAWRDNKGKGRHGSEGQDSCHDGGTEGGTRRMAAASLTVDFVGGVNGISGGIKEVGGALPASPRNGRGHDGCPGVFIAPSSSYGARIFEDGIAFDNRRHDEQDASARLVRNALLECWDGMKCRHDSSTEGGMGRRVAAMKALNLNNFCHAAFCRAAPRSAALCHCRAAPRHATPCRRHAPPCRRRAPPCHATPCRTTRPSLVMPPSLMLHCASLVLAGCCIAWSLVAPMSPSRRLVVESSPLSPHCHLSHCTAASLITPPLSRRAVPLILCRASLIAPLLHQ
jgi:hypothetical protein